MTTTAPTGEEANRAPDAQAPRPSGEPGLYPGIPEGEYHADRTSLSHSGAKLILRSPAHYRWALDHPTHKDAFDFGSAAHRLVLGVGPEIVTIYENSWQTKSAREKREEARAGGYIPLLLKDRATVKEMADALSTHDLAMRLLSDGQAEVSAYAVDEATGVMRRGRFDWLGTSVLTDYKTAASSDPAGFASSAAKFGYEMQAAWYLSLAADLGHPAEAFAFIVQEKEPPYVVTVVELDDAAIQLGRAKNRRALERFRDCRESDIWPGYVRSDEFITVSLPRWAYRAEEDLA